MILLRNNYETCESSGGSLSFGEFRKQLARLYAFIIFCVNLPAGRRTVLHILRYELQEFGKYATVIKQNLDTHSHKRRYLTLSGHIPIISGWRIYMPFADVAQLAEQRFCKPQVMGSSPFVGSTLVLNFILGQVSLSSARIALLLRGSECCQLMIILLQFYIP